MFLSFLVCQILIINFLKDIKKELSTFFNLEITEYDNNEEKYIENTNFCYGVYDVNKFRERMRQSRERDEDGLYDVQEENNSTPFTGVEIITNSYEVDLERQFDTGR